MPESDPPLVDIKITNPLTYLKRWWDKVIGNEGVDFRLHFHPLTAIVITLIVLSVGFGLGWQVSPTPSPSPSPTPTPEPQLKDTAFIGTLHYSQTTAKFYLVTSSSAEAITLVVPAAIDLEPLIGKRILAAGNYSKSTRTLEVLDAKDMEILPKSPLPIPTATPETSPSATLPL